MKKKLNPFDPDNFKNEHVMQWYRKRLKEHTGFKPKSK